MIYKQSKKKYLIKGILFAILAGVFGVALFLTYFFIQLNKSNYPQVYSTSQVGKTDTKNRNKIAGMIKSWFNIDVPLTAEDLYFAQYGAFMGYEQYAAFRLPNEKEVEDFFKALEVDNKTLKKGNSFSGPPWDEYCLPQKWETKYQDVNWRLSEGKEFLYSRYAQHVGILVYMPDEYRIYLIYSAGP